MTRNNKKNWIRSRCYAPPLGALSHSRIFSMHIERIHRAFTRFRCTIHKIATRIPLAQSHGRDKKRHFRYDTRKREAYPSRQIPNIARTIINKSTHCARIDDFPLNFDAFKTSVERDCVLKYSLQRIHSKNVYLFYICVYASR